MTKEYSDEYSELRAHPYVQQLLDTGNYDLVHAYDVDDETRKHSLTAGVLMGPDLIAHTPLTLFRKDALIEEKQESEIFVFYHLGPRLCGHKGIVHGGLLATLLDESLCRCGFPLLPNRLGVTASLDIQYLAPTVAGGFVVLRAVSTKVDGRKVWIEGQINQLPRADVFDPAQDLVVSTKAKVLLVEPRWVQKLSKMPKGDVEKPAEEAQPAA